MFKELKETYENNIGKALEFKENEKCTTVIS